MRIAILVTLLLSSASAAAAQSALQGSGAITAIAMVQRPPVMLAARSEAVDAPAAGARQRSEPGGLTLSFNRGASYEVTMEAADAWIGAEGVAGRAESPAEVQWCAGACRSSVQFRSLEADRPILVATSRSADAAVVDLRFQVPATDRERSAASPAGVVLTVVID